MNSLSWNCQGLRGPWRVRMIRSLLRDNNPSLVFLCETRCGKNYFDYVKLQLDLDGFCVEANGNSGGLALLWRKDLNVTLQSFSLNHIDVTIMMDPPNASWRFTGFYGEFDWQKRKSSWALIDRLSRQSVRPWLITGDFNEVINNEEIQGGNPRPNSMINTFRNCLLSAGLVDLGFKGFPFTWMRNPTNPNSIRCHLDRSVATKGWCNLFPRAVVKHLATTCSDHCPILTMTNPDITPTKRRTKLFRFEAAWARDDECKEIIDKHWNSFRERPTMEKILHNIESCKVGLIHWSQKFGNAEKRIKKLEEKLIEIGRGQIDDSSRIQEQNVKSELEELICREEIKWKQRAKIQWLRDGDKNTKYFHLKASHRAKTNRISALRDEAGVLRSKDLEVRDIIERYFAGLFSSEVCPEPEMLDMLRGLEPRVTDSMQQSLTLPYTEEEVKRAISEMYPLKSPGLDGFPPFFFQKYWNIVGKDVILCVLEFLNNGHFDKKLNFTHIVLIPKCKSPETITQFRPISLCNVVYKIASKVLANRLKPFLDHIVSSTQSAFISNRLITDNISIAFEINHFLKQKEEGKNGFFALKIDMSKAYDRVEWSFLKNVLFKFGFPTTFVNLVMKCVTTVTYSFLLDGMEFGNLSPERGLRQGDPLSPYLFLLCAEIFTFLLQEEESKGNLKGITICRDAPKVSHLLFADDTLLCGQATPESLICIKNLLSKYEKVSGQTVNMAKSSITFSRNIDPNSQLQLAAIIGVQRVGNLDLYLGLPSVVGQSKRTVFASIRDRINKKIQGFSEKFLSKAGKEILIKAVLQALPSYTIPDFLIKELNSTICNFFWNNRGDHRLHWISWNKLCGSKKTGGLGFRDLKLFNLAMLAKQAWRILQNPQSLLSRIFKAKYFPHSNFLNAKLGRSPSFTWRSIWEARYIVAAGCCWRIGSGDNINILRDRWIPKPPSFRPAASTIMPEGLLTVNQLLEPSGRAWNESLVLSTFNTEDAQAILNIPLGDTRRRDRLTWHFTKNGMFSVRSAYHLARDLAAAEQGLNPHTRPTKLWQQIWQTKAAPKVKSFAWRAAHDILPTSFALSRRHCTSPGGCPLCNAEFEDRIHALVDCPFSRQVWALSNFPQHLIDELKSDFMKGLSKALDELVDAEQGRFLATLWSIWNNRNKKLKEDNIRNPIDISNHANSFSSSFLGANQVSDNRVSQPPPNRWIHPSPGWVKINFDAAIFKETREIGIGIVARDHLGSCFGWEMARINGPNNPEYAESKACLSALKLARDFGWQKVIVEGDCKNLIYKLRSGIEDLSYLGNLIDDIRCVARNFDCHEFSFVRRDANKIAHALARNTASASVVGLGYLPPFVLELFTSDLNE